MRSAASVGTPSTLASMPPSFAEVREEIITCCIGSASRLASHRSRLQISVVPLFTPSSPMRFGSTTKMLLVATICSIREVSIASLSAPSRFWLHRNHYIAPPPSEHPRPTSISNYLATGRSAPFRQPAAALFDASLSFDESHHQRSRPLRQDHRHNVRIKCRSDLPKADRCGSLAADARIFRPLMGF